jgi:hypothetical protein
MGYLEIAVNRFNVERKIQCKWDGVKMTLKLGKHCESVEESGLVVSRNCKRNSGKRLKSE